MSDTDSSVSESEDEPIDFEKVSTTPMGKTNVKYCPTIFLGKGRSAIVYPGYHFGKIIPTAVKLIDDVYLRSKKDYKNELIIWSDIEQNINIIRLYDSYKVKAGMFLAMELAERTFRKQITQFSPEREDILKWLHQVSSAVEYLHGKGVIHRDVKPDNILMVKQDGNRIIAKLADFGVSKMLSNAELSGTFSKANGTELWMAPEAITSQTGTFKNTRMLDIYPLGMVIYFGLSLGGHPFSKSDNDDLGKVWSKMTSDSAKPFELEVNEVGANDLISKMLQRMPEYRPQIGEVTSHCLFWNLEQEQIFLIRAAICLSKQKCEVTESIKSEIDKTYSTFYQSLYPGSTFNWVEIAEKARNMNIPELFFDRPGQKKRTEEYGNGDSVTKFLKFFRDKFVHYPEMKPEASINFKDNDGTFCEEKYVKDLISMCPGLSALLYQNLQTYANEPIVMPLSKIYFKWKFANTNKPSLNTVDMPSVKEVIDEEEEMKQNVERLGNSDVYIFKDSYINDNLQRGYYRRPGTPVAIKTRKMSKIDAEKFSSKRSDWSKIWLVGKSERSSFLISVYCLVEQSQVLYIAMEIATSSLFLKITNGAIKMPNDVDQVISYLHNISEAVGWLHDKSVPHQKITAKNVLIFDAGENRKMAKLGISDPCYLRTVSIQETNAFGLDVTALGKVFKFSFFNDDNQRIVLSSSQMYVSNHLVKWMNQNTHSVKPQIWQVLDHPLFWDDEKSLQFICDFSNVLRSTVIRWEANMINPKGSAYFYTETSNDPYTWKEKVDSRLIKGLKEEDLTNFPSLLELIERIVRNQNANTDSELTVTKNIDENAIRELFYSESNSFCAKKLFYYFTERFPELLLLCFCATVKFQLNNWQLLHKYTKQSCDKQLDYSAWRNQMPIVIDQ